MKTIFNKSLGIFIFSFALGISTLAYAANTRSPAETPKGNSIDNFCSKLSSLSSKVSQEIADKSGKLDLNRSEKDKKLGEKRTEIDQKTGDNRSKWDKNRADQYAKLGEKADTDVKKQALLTFQNAVDKAVADRRSAINAAQDVFRKGIDQLLTSRETKVSQVTAEYKTAIGDAIKKAETACSDSSKATEIRQVLKDALKNARLKFNSEKQGIDKLGEQVKTLTEARKTAFEKAKSEYKTVLEKAKTDLKAAFGVLTSPTPTLAPSPTTQP